MKTDKAQKSKNSKQTSIEAKNKEDLNQKASWQFIVSTTVGVLTIITLAASFYYGIIHF